MSIIYLYFGYFSYFFNLANFVEPRFSMGYFLKLILDYIFLCKQFSICCSLMNDSQWVMFVAISRLVFTKNLDITILELQNSICFPAVLSNIMLFDSDSLCYFCNSIPCRKLDTLLAETVSILMTLVATVSIGI